MRRYSYWRLAPSDGWLMSQWVMGLRSLEPRREPGGEKTTGVTSIIFPL
jgi:hypothetical protein